MLGIVFICVFVFLIVMLVVCVGAFCYTRRDAKAAYSTSTGMCKKLTKNYPDFAKLIFLDDTELHHMDGESVNGLDNGFNKNTAAYQSETDGEGRQNYTEYVIAQSPHSPHGKHALFISCALH